MQLTIKNCVCHKFGFCFWSHMQMLQNINSLGPVDAFKRPKIFVFFSKKKKKKIGLTRFPTYLVSLFESPMSYPPGYHV